VVPEYRTPSRPTDNEAVTNSNTRNKLSRSLEDSMKRLKAIDQTVHGDVPLSMVFEFCSVSL